MGESLGKANIGLTPTVSIGSTDLHSVGQLYLGGAKNKFTTFVSTQKQKHTVKIPNFKEFDVLVENIQNKSLSFIMDSILHGVQKAYKNNHVPFCTVVLPEINAYYVGQFLQLSMLEMIYLGKLLKVNPFDQPHVELYKQETRKILAHE
jgi:glucose-6-phosphate isomerase